MKFNFTVVNSSSTDIRAESNVSYVAPQDFVGEGRISRFRLSSTTFPLAFIQPSNKLYSSYQKDAISSEGITPTDIGFGFYIPYSDTSQMKYDSFVQQSAFIAPTNGVGSWYQGVTQESGAQSGTVTIPKHNLDGNIAIPTLTHFNLYVQPQGGGESEGNPSTVTSTLIDYNHKIKQFYFTQPETTMSINLGTSISERMIKYMGAILNTNQMVNTPLDPHGGGDARSFSILGCYVFIVYYYFNEPPVWEEVEEGQFKLKNKGKFIHSWDLKDEIGAERTFSYNYTFRGYTSASDYTEITPIYFAKPPSINFTHVNDTTFNVQLNCPVNFIDVYGVTGTPVLIMSPFASSFFNCDTHTDLFYAEFPLSTQLPFPDLVEPAEPEQRFRRLWFKIPLCDAKIINPQTDLVDYHVALDFTSSFTLHVPPSIINPVTCLILTSPSLSFKGESISVDTQQLQGVISPSSLPILRTFFVGFDSNKERSDLVFVDDMLTSYPIIFDSPRIVNVKLCLYALTKTNDLVLMELPPSADMAIQISIV